jgi:hypothetical protein
MHSGKTKRLVGLPFATGALGPGKISRNSHVASPSVYLALAIWGAIHPMYWFVTYMRETGTGLSGLIDAWFVNASTTGLTWDLTIAAVTLTVWILAETWVRKNWIALIACRPHSGSASPADCRSTSF